MAKKRNGKSIKIDATKKEFIDLALDSIVDCRTEPNTQIMGYFNSYRAKSDRYLPENIEMISKRKVEEEGVATAYEFAKTISDGLNNLFNGNAPSIFESPIYKHPYFKSIFKDGYFSVAYSKQNNYLSVTFNAKETIIEKILGKREKYEKKLEDKVKEAKDVVVSLRLGKTFPNINSKIEVDELEYCFALKNYHIMRRDMFGIVNKDAILRGDFYLFSGQPMIDIYQDLIINTINPIFKKLRVENDKEKIVEISHLFEGIMIKNTLMLDALLNVVIKGYPVENDLFMCSLSMLYGDGIPYLRSIKVEETNENKVNLKEVIKKIEDVVNNIDMKSNDYMSMVAIAGIGKSLSEHPLLMTEVITDNKLMNFIENIRGKIEQLNEQLHNIVVSKKYSELSEKDQKNFSFFKSFAQKVQSDFKLVYPMSAGYINDILSFDGNLSDKDLFLNVESDDVNLNAQEVKIYSFNLNEFYRDSGIFLSQEQVIGFDVINSFVINKCFPDLIAYPLYMKPSDVEKVVEYYAQKSEGFRTNVLMELTEEHYVENVGEIYVKVSSKRKEYVASIVESIVKYTMENFKYNWYNFSRYKETSHNKDLSFNLITENTLLFNNTLMAIADYVERAIGGDSRITNNEIQDMITLMREKALKASMQKSDEKLEQPKAKFTRPKV